LDKLKGEAGEMKIKRDDERGRSGAGFVRKGFVYVLSCLRSKQGGGGRWETNHTIINGEKKRTPRAAGGARSLQGFTEGRGEKRTDAAVPTRSTKGGIEGGELGRGKCTVRI